MKKRVTALFLAALLGLSVTACGTQEEIQEAHRVSVSGILPETGDVIVTTTYIGTVEPKESITVYPMVDGNITQMSAALGKEVKKGEALFTLDNTEANKAVTEAQEEYDVLKKAADEAKKDVEQAEKDTETAKKDAATAILNSIKTNLSTAVNELKDSKTELNDAEDNLEDYVEGKTGNVTIGKAGRDDVKKFISQAESELKSAEDAIASLETEVAKIELTETQLKGFNDNFSEAKNLMTKAKNYLSNAKGNVESTMSEKARKEFADDVDDAKEKLDSAQSYLNKAKNNLPATAELKKTTTADTESGTSLTTTVTTAYEQQLLLAEKKLNEAKALLELYQVMSPIDGVVEAVYIDQNEKAFMDEPCLVISNKSNIEVTFQVPEKVALALNVGERVKVEKNGGMYEATITEIGLMADVQTKLFAVKASLGAVNGFSTGTDVKVHAETQKVTNVMKIPYDSLYFQSGNAYVYCVVDEVAVRRPVQVGIMNDESAQILEGLEPTDIVVSTWSSQLKDGAEVHLLFVIGNSDTVDVPQDENAPEQITDDSDPVDTEITEEESKWALPDLD